MVYLDIKSEKRLDHYYFEGEGKIELELSSMDQFFNAVHGSLQRSHFVAISRAKTDLKEWVPPKKHYSWQSDNLILLNISAKGQLPELTSEAELSFPAVCKFFQ